MHILKNERYLSIVFRYDTMRHLGIHICHIVALKVYKLELEAEKSLTSPSQLHSKVM